jgi:hypothetical protein
VRVTIGDAEPVDAEPTENGIYTIPFPHLARTGSVEVVFNVTATSGDDLLVGGLTLPSDTEPSDGGASSIGAVSSIWISSIPWGIRHPIVLILITFGLGVLFGHLHRSGPFRCCHRNGRCRRLWLRWVVMTMIVPATPCERTSPAARRYGVRREAYATLAGSSYRCSRA